MNSLSQKEISCQLFHLAKESIKTIVLNSKCGLLAQVRVPKKSSINDISILNNFSPVLCLYRKASPMFIHNKTSHGFDESSFKKEINPSTNAIMTLCLLELSEYYSHYEEGNRNVLSLEKPFKYLAKEQLQFYSENLRNNEGLFVDKKNTSDGNSKGFSLIDKDGNFKFSDQAFMMTAYLLYSYYSSDDEISNDYLNFSHEILNMLRDYKSALYDLSFGEITQVFLSLNIFYKYSPDDDVQKLILDLGDFLITKFQEKDYYLDSIDDCSLFYICLIEAYKHTEIISFKEMAKEIIEKLTNLYDSDKNMFIKLNDKKESKYSCLEVNFYLLALIISSLQEDNTTELRPIISGIYRKFFVNGGLLTSWPEAPTLDEVERYKKLSLRSDDMLDETYFRMPICPTPKSTGLASVFVKSLNYSKKKDALSINRNSFDSNKNMINFFLIIYLLKDVVEDLMEFNFYSNSEMPMDLRYSDSEVNPNISSTINNTLCTQNSSELIKSTITLNSSFVKNSNSLEESKNKSALKNPTNNLLSNKNNFPKINSSLKSKKYKKNKPKNPHTTKKA
jgi:hypothetical protein